MKLLFTLKFHTSIWRTKKYLVKTFVYITKNPTLQFDDFFLARNPIPKQSVDLHKWYKYNSLRSLTSLSEQWKTADLWIFGPKKPVTLKARPQGTKWRRIRSTIPVDLSLARQRRSAVALLSRSAPRTTSPVTPVDLIHAPIFPRPFRVIFSRPMDFLDGSLPSNRFWSNSEPKYR